jgi:hypothetical protein
VVTKGTPHELVNDEIAIKAYLGRSFEEDGFTRHFAARAGRSAGAVLGGAAATSDPSPFPQPEPSPFVATAPPPRTGPLGGTAGTVLELERLRRSVEGLADDRTMKAATVELARRPELAIPVLIEALERRESVIRRRAFELLKYVARDAGHLEFDPDASDELRLRQVAYLRARLERHR